MHDDDKVCMMKRCLDSASCIDQDLFSALECDSWVCKWNKDRRSCYNCSFETCILFSESDLVVLTVETFVSGDVPLSYIFRRVDDRFAIIDATTIKPKDLKLQSTIELWVVLHTLCTECEARLRLAAVMSTSWSTTPAL